MQKSTRRFLDQQANRNQEHKTERRTQDNCQKQRKKSPWLNFVHQQQSEEKKKLRARKLHGGNEGRIEEEKEEEEAPDENEGGKDDGTGNSSL